MKTIIFKSLLVVIIVIGISNYLLYLKTGQLPIIKLPSMDIASKLPTKDSVQNLVGDSSSGKEKLYKWTDAKGKVHYSTQAPLNKASAKEIFVDPNANVVKAIKVPKPEVKRGAEQRGSNTRGSEAAPANAYNPETVKTLIDDAKEVQALMDARTERLDEAINSH